jgi:hypothetical protein
MKPFDEHPSDDFAREVLASARRAHPLASARERALAAGLGALGPVPPATGGDGGGAGGGGAAGAAKAAALKWLAATAGAAMVAGAVVAAGPPTKSATAPAPPAPPTSSLAIPAAASIPPPAPRAPEERPPPSAPSARSDAPRTVASSSPAPRDALGDELALIDAARCALNDGDPSKALAQLDAYDRSHRSGALRLEGTVLRVEALARSGRRADAERLGRSILNETGGGAYRTRLEKTLGQVP